MKRLFSVILAFCLPILVYCQGNPIDDLFEKYSEREGFTSVIISSKMFSMFAEQNKEKKSEDDFVLRLKSIRILTVEDTLLNKNINFYTELGKKLDFKTYEELMVVKEGKDMTKFLVVQKGDRITELLVITGGPGGNSLISIKGDFSLKNISDISKSTGIQELKSLEDIDEKK